MQFKKFRATLLFNLYRTLWHIAPFFIRRRLKQRAKSNQDYLHHWNERFGEPFKAQHQGALWIHAVSMGETQAAEPIIRAWKKRFPDHAILLTHSTPTGRRSAKNLYPFAECRYLPYDKTAYVTQFLRDHQPLAGVIMETEIWPNMVALCHDFHVPLFLANARLSQQSLKGYLRAKSLLYPLLSTLAGCFSQSEQDAARLVQLGAKSLVTGNTKFDITMSETLQQAAKKLKNRIGNRLVVTAGSTRFFQQQDEAALLLKAWQKMKHEALLIIVPRHPERFEATFETACNLGFRVQKKSEGGAIRPETEVLIGNSMGELLAYYWCANVAFVGGSLVNAGSHSMIEPISCGVPTLFGPSTYNFAQAASDALQSGAAICVQNESDWADQTVALLHNDARKKHMQKEALKFIASHQGAGESIVQHIANTLQLR